MIAVLERCYATTEAAAQTGSRSLLAQMKLETVRIQRGLYASELAAAAEIDRSGLSRLILLDNFCRD